MKKLFLLAVLICIGQMYGMEPLEPMGSFAQLPKELHEEIIMALLKSKDLEQAVEAIKVACVLRGACYDNLKDFTRLAHIFANQFNVSTYQIAKKFNTSTANEYNILNTQLMVAIQSSDIQKLTDLINEGADVNYSTDLNTPLTKAVIQWNLQIIKLLLQHGANPNFNHPYSGTALALAEERHARAGQTDAQHRKKREEIIILLQEAMKKEQK